MPINVRKCEKLEKAFHSLKGRDRITEINVAESLKEVRRALVEADVSYKVAKEFVARVKEKAIGQEVLTSLKPGQVMVKVTRDEMADLMGGNAEELSLEGKPNIILIAGLQGSGKTTFSGKLASYLKRKKGKRPLLVACDVYRPAAIDQLKVLETGGCGSLQSAGQSRSRGHRFPGRSACTRTGIQQCDRRYGRTTRRGSGDDGRDRPGPQGHPAK